MHLNMVNIDSNNFDASVKSPSSKNVQRNPAFMSKMQDQSALNSERASANTMFN